MKILVKLLVNIAAFVVLLICSVEIFGFPTLTLAQTDKFIGYTKVLHIPDSELTYGLFFTGLHALLALVVLIFINIGLKKWLKRKSTTASA